MNEQLNTQLKKIFDEIVTHTPKPGSAPRSEPMHLEQPGPHRRPWLAVAAVAVVIAGIGSLVALTARGDTVEPAASNPAATKPPPPSAPAASAPSTPSWYSCTQACSGFDLLPVVAGVTDFYTSLGESTVAADYFDKLTRCVELTADFKSCAKIEGIAGVSLVSYPATGVDTGGEISIGTTFTDLTPLDYALQWGTTQDSGTQQAAIVRGHDAIRYQNETAPAVVWQERPGVLVWVSVPPDQQDELLTIAEAVQREDGPTTIPNRVVIPELSKPWSAIDNDGNGLIVASKQGVECVGLDQVDTCGDDIGSRTIVRPRSDGTTTVAGSAPVEAATIRINIAGSESLDTQTIPFADSQSRFYSVAVPAGFVESVTWVAANDSDLDTVPMALPSPGTDPTDPTDPTVMPSTTTVTPSTTIDTALSHCEDPGGCGTYVVRAGDAPILVAEKFCITVAELAAVNGWNAATDFAAPDDTILIPPSDGRITCPNPTAP